MCDNFKEKQTTLTFSDPGLPKSYLELKIRKTNVVIRINILEIPCVPIFRQNWHFYFLSPNLPKNEFWGRNFKNLSLDSESTPPKYHVCQFLVKIWGNCPITCNILVQILLRVLQRAGWRLKWAGWRWMELGGGWNELGGGGWSWVELGAWFSNALLKVVLHTRLNVYWESSGGSRFVTQSLGVIQMVTNKIYFMHQFDFPSK